MNQSIYQSIYQSINLSIYQSIYLSINQSINQSINLLYMYRYVYIMCMWFIIYSIGDFVSFFYNRVGSKIVQIIKITVLSGKTDNYLNPLCNSTTCLCFCFLQSYGYEHLVTFANLKRLGLFTESDVRMLTLDIYIYIYSIIYVVFSWHLNALMSFI